LLWALVVDQTLSVKLPAIPLERLARLSRHAFLSFPSAFFPFCSVRKNRSSPFSILKKVPLVKAGVFSLSSHVGNSAHNYGGYLIFFMWAMSLAILLVHRPLIGSMRV